MRYETWMNETRRGLFKPRSKALKAVDRAFSRCGDSSVGHSRLRAELLDKLIAWINTKGDRWQQSIRNTRKDARGKGTVERLVEGFALDPNFAPRLIQAGLINRPIPPLPNTRPIPPVPAHRPIPALPRTRPVPPTPAHRPIPAIPAHAVPPGEAYRPGKIDNKKDCDGKWHRFIRQEKSNSCVPATVTMMKRAWGGANFNDLSEPYVRGLMTLNENGRLNQGVSTLSNYAQTQHNWQMNGTTATRAVEVLKMNPFPVKTAYSVPGALVSLTLLRNLTPRKPGLVGWRWRGGGGHATLCIGPSNDNTQLKIIDPWHGIQYVDNTQAGFSTYHTPTGSIGDLIVAVFGK
ncbi:MAG: papain-like cysteine protease family protein [Pseudomonadota bacterium]